jgi:hypothetical protein
MRFGKFGAGVIVGLAIGAALPLAAQSMSSILSAGAHYGIPPASLITFGCTSGSGWRVGVTMDHVPKTLYVGTQTSTGVQLVCN